MSSCSPEPNLTTICITAACPLPYLGHLLNRAAHEVGQQADARLEAIGIRVKHYMVLLLLTQMDAALPQKEIGERLRIDRNTMVSLIDELEAQRLVERARDPNDRRAYAISVTKQGCAVATQAGQLIEEADSQFAQGLTATELAELVRLLAKLLHSAAAPP